MNPGPVNALRATALLLLLVLLAGCAAAQEDRDFFQDGWRHPEQGADKRMNRSGW